MCLSIRQLDSKTRRTYAAGNICLFSAILFQTAFEDGFGLRHPALFNGARFFLFGCTIGLMSWFAHRRRRATNSRP
ncbi:MAG: hypothetical protein ACP5E2_15545 [Terracidiphilus sp.]